jgi:uncharacterized protein (TIGR02246 family)
MSKIEFKYLAVFVVLLYGFSLARAQEPAPGSSDEQSIRESAERYCEAFNHGDIDALQMFWASDAEYVDANGATHHGNKAIGALFKDAKEDLNGHTLDLEIESLRLVNPDVAIENGTATVSSPEGDATRGRFTAVLVKNGGKWLISSAHDLPADEEAVSSPASNADYLKPLEWLVGEWVSEDQGPSVNVTADWALEKSYLVLDYYVTKDAGAEMRVMQWIGYDPLTGQIKSWTFDSHGGYGVGLWSQEDDVWQIDTIGVLPDGRTGEALGSLLSIDENHCEWRSTARTVENQPLPDVEVRFVRRDARENADSP